MASWVSSLGRHFFNWWNPPWFQGVSFLVESMHLVRAYHVAAELGIADLVHERPRSAVELAEATRTHAGSLHRMLRALAAFGVFRQDRQGRFHMTRRAQVLLSDHPRSMRSWLRLMGSAEVWRGFAHTVESVRTGRAAFELAHGRRFYDYMNEHPELGATFVKAMSGWTQWHCRELVRAYDFSRFDKVVDVGGGMGALLAHLLAANPKLHGILFDEAPTIEMARQKFREAGLDERVEFASGSFLDFVPRGADLCIVKHVLSDWDDERAIRILHNCHGALAPGGTVLVIGPLVDPRNGTDRIVKLVDLEMGALTGGVLHGEAQVRSLLERAGFQQFKRHATLVPDCQIFEARKGVQAIAAPHPGRRPMPVEAGGLRQAS